MFDLPNTPAEIFKFLIEVIIIRGILSRKVGIWIDKHIFDRLQKRFIDPFMKLIRSRLVTTHREAAIWLHYWNKAHQKGHQHKNPIVCNDDRCRLI